VKRSPLAVSLDGSRDAEKVLIAVNDLHPYGAQVVASTVASSLAGIARSVQLVTVDVPTLRELTVQPELERVSLGRRPGGGVIGYARAVVAARRLVRRTAPDVVIAHMLLTNVVFLAATLGMRRKPVVLVTEHNVTQNLAVEGRPGVMRLLARVLYPRAHRVLGVSEGVAADIAAAYHLPATLVLAVTNPVDVARVRQRAATPAEHPWLDQPTGDPVVACVAGFRHAKGQDLLVEALVHTPGVRVLFIGEGPTRPAIEELARNRGVADRVDFLGHRDHPMAYVRRCRALVMPSRWEGFGLVAVEAAAVGVPVLGTAVPGVDELVGGRVPGLLVPATVQALADGLVELLASTSLAEAALGDFAPEAVAAAYLRAAC
jgi:glycosyltransferase involved in cell wall biosynthesis